MDIKSPLAALPSIRECISEALPDHDRLVQKCLDAAHAAESLPESRSKIANLRRLAYGTKLELAVARSCRNSTKTERKGRQGIDTIVNRLSGYILRRNMNALKEVQALQARYKEEKRLVESIKGILNSYNEQLEAALRAHKDLETAVADHKSALVALDALYESVFAGPTPEFPQEDYQELLVVEAYRRVQDLKRRMRHEQRALHLLQKTGPPMRVLIRQIEDAVQAVAERISDPEDKSISERQDKALKAAKGTTIEILTLVMKAFEESPGVACRWVDIPDTPRFDGEVEDPPSATSNSTDGCLADFHTALRRTQDEIAAWDKRLDREAKRAARRRDEAATKVARAQKRLDEKRTKLRGVRQGIFIEVMKELPEY